MHPLLIYIRLDAIVGKKREKKYIFKDSCYVYRKDRHNRTGCILDNDTPIPRDRGRAEERMQEKKEGKKQA